MLGVGMTTPSKAHAEWVNEGSAGEEWYNNGVPSGRFISMETLKQLESEAAAGAINGGGAVPKGFSTPIVESGKSEWNAMVASADTTANQSAWWDVKGWAADSMVAVKAMPLLTKLGTVVAAASAFQIGWEIGGGSGTIFDFFFGSGGETTPTQSHEYKFHAFVPFNRKTNLCLPEFTTPKPENGTCKTTEGTPLLGPYSGFSAMFENKEALTRSTKWENSGTTECTGLAGWSWLSTPPYFEHEPVGSVNCGKGTLPFYIEIQHVKIECLPGQKSNGCPHSVKEKRTAEKPTPLEGESAREAIDSCFVDPKCNPFSAWWYNHNANAKEKTSGVGMDPASPVEVDVPKPGPTELYPEYDKQLEELGLTPNPEELPLKEVQKEKRSKVVIFTKPTWGRAVEPKSTVTVQYNPAIVPAPNTGELYKAYDKRLEELGLVPENAVLSETAIDTELGPEAVTATEPAVETTVYNGSTVKVRYNPSTAPPPITSSTCSTTIGAVDWSPLNQPLGSKFPFGVFGFFVGWIGEWTASSEAPSWDFTIIPSGLFGSKGLTIHVDLASMVTVAEVIRVAFLFASFVGLLWFLGTAAMKLQGDSS
jgi:hypothetical protein